MKNLNHQLMKLCRQNRDGSFSTQATRSRILDLSANQLHALGYRHMQATSLKPKHVEALIAHWRGQGASTGTLKNRLSALRWWAQKVNRESIIARDNTAYGIGSRTYVAEQPKGQVLDQAKLAGLSRLRGLRHAYAQRRYRELTGKACPAAGGLPSKQLTTEQRVLDEQARLTISNELGHAREAISAVYLGR